MGPLGAELKRNLKDYWWRVMVRERDDVVGLDGSIITHRAALKASGHEDTFSDPMVDCRTCKARLRADQLPEKNGAKQCPNCGGKDLTEPRAFNLMFRTHLGATEDESSRSPTSARRRRSRSLCSSRMCSIRLARSCRSASRRSGKRSETKSTRAISFSARASSNRWNWSIFARRKRGCGCSITGSRSASSSTRTSAFPRSKLHVLTVPDADRAFYSKGTYDIEYQFPFGVQELEGVAYRTDYDLTQHQQASGKPLEYFDEESKQKFVPHVVEPSAGVDRTLLALICEAFDEETVTDEKGKAEVRTVMRFHPRMAPIKVGVFPLLKNKPELVAKAREVHALLKPHMMAFYDEGGAIGRRYRRQDEAGTPFGITIDFETLGERGDELRDTVTLAPPRFHEAGAGENRGAARHAAAARALIL